MGALAGGELPLDLYSADGSTLLGSGKLALVDNQINQATSTIRLKAIAPNPRRLLWPNQFVNARLRLATSQGAIVMPATAVQRGPSGAFVYVISGDSTVSARPVEIAATQGDQAMVRSGVGEGERVMVDGQNQLRPGSRVVAREQQVAGAPKVAADGADAARAGAGGGAR